MAQEVAQYKELFLSEARGHLAAMNEALLQLEKAPGKKELVTTVLRALHTLKGMAATMGYEETARLCHAMEDLLEVVKTRRLLVAACADPLFEGVDTLAGSLKELSQGRSELDTSRLIDRLSTLVKDRARRGQGEEAESPLSQAPNLQSSAVEKITSIEVKVEQLDALMNLAEEFLIAKMRLDRVKGHLKDPELGAAVDTLGRLMAELQYHAMQARLVPIGFVFNRFPRMVRDLAKRQHKEVDLRLEGGDLELDRAVIDAIGESLVHLLRNAVDHGIETPEERRKVGKPPQGIIRLSATRTKEFAVIEVSDDGTGLDLDAIKASAQRRGLLSPEVTKEEVVEAIFAGVSTTQHPTPISGRGLGLNIVKQKIESLGGRISVASEPPRGTAFILEIPLTLAVIKTLLVDVGGTPYAIPLANIERLVTVGPEEIKGLLEHEAIVLNETDIPITRLAALFALVQRELEKQPVVIVRRGDALLGLAVDALLATQEVVIKPLGRFVRENRYFAGCTIVGSGEVVLILDVASLVVSRRPAPVAA